MIVFLMTSCRQAVNKFGDLLQDNKLNYELLHLELTTYINGMTFKWYDKILYNHTLSSSLKPYLLYYYSYLFPVSGLEGPQADFRKTVSWMKTDVLEDFEKILSRYKKFPTQVKFDLKNMHTVCVGCIRSTAQVVWHC